MADLYSLLEKYRYSLLEKKGVIGVGIGYKEIKGKVTKKECLVVYVDKKVPITKLDINDVIPATIEHKITDVKEIGKVKALYCHIRTTFTPKRTDRWRPAPGGVSIGHESITAGTLGMKIDASDGSYILSNNHVLANSNDAIVGDIIYQPGVYDQPLSKENEIGVLFDFISIYFENNECKVVKGILKVLNTLAKLVKSRYRFKADKRVIYNRVDAALCRPFNEDDVLYDILEVGIPNGYAEAQLNDSVLKSGRTTGLTKGIVIDTNATIKVNYGPNKDALFENQIITTAKSASGDSGSILVRDTNVKPVVGLLFAGSTEISVCNHIKNVQEALNI